MLPRIIAAISVLSLLPALNSAQIEPALDDPYAQQEIAEEDGALYARLRYLDEPLGLQRGDHLRSDLEPNDPLIPGDRLITTDGRAELQLADGSLVRLDLATELAMLSLHDSSNNLGHATVLQLTTGRIIIRANPIDSNNERFQIDTSAASVFLLSQGLVRIDARPTGDTVVAVIRGSAEVMADGVSAIVRTGERVFVRTGEIPGQPMVFNTLARDGFSRWSVERDELLTLEIAGNEIPPDLPGAVRPYASELSSYGTWINTPSFGWVWRPVGVASGWQPYYYGRWAYTPAGLVWVSSEPWGWAPYRYGRWEFALGTGWVWIPGYVYAGAHVAWGFSPGYFGWCPLGYYNYPVRVTFSFGHHGYPWVHVRNRHVYNRHVHKSVIKDRHVIREIEREYIIVRGTPRLNPDRINHPGSLDRVHRRVAERRDIHVDRTENRRRTPFLENDRQRLVQRNNRRVREAGRSTVESPGRGPQARAVSSRPSNATVTAPSRSRSQRAPVAASSNTNAPRRRPAVSRSGDPSRSPSTRARNAVPASRSNRETPRATRPGPAQRRPASASTGATRNSRGTSRVTSSRGSGSSSSRKATSSRGSGSSSSRKATSSRSRGSSSSRKATSSRSRGSSSSRKATSSRSRGSSSSRKATSSRSRGSSSSRKATSSRSRGSSSSRKATSSRSRSGGGGKKSSKGKSSGRKD